MAKPTPRSPTTDRLYYSVQLKFRRWCRQQRIRFPPGHEAIAQYLENCATERGHSTVPVHLSAIARLYRDAGRRLDTKAPEIQQVVAVARAAMICR